MLSKKDHVVYVVKKVIYTTDDMDVIKSEKLSYAARDEGKAREWAARAQDNAWCFAADTTAAFYIDKYVESALPAEMFIH